MTNFEPRSNLEYTLGILFFLLGLGLLGLTLYLVPYSFFNMNYEVPAFIMKARANIEELHGITGPLQMLFILLLPFFSSIICFVLARQYTARIDFENLRSDDTVVEEFRTRLVDLPNTNSKPTNQTRPINISKLNNKPLFNPVIVILLGILCRD